MVTKRSGDVSFVSQGEDLDQDQEEGEGRRVESGVGRGGRYEAG